MSSESGHEAGRLRSILDASDDAIITTDLEGRVIDWNERATDLFGWSAEDVRGKVVGSFLVPEYARDAFFLGLDSYRKDGDSSVLEKHRETTAMCDDGREVPVEISTSIVSSRDSTVCAMFIRDLSERHREDRRRFRRLLETRLIHEHSDTASDVETVVLTGIEVACGSTPRVGGLAYDVAGDTLRGMTSWFRNDVVGGAELALQHTASSTTRPDGLLGQVIRSRRSASTNDIRTDPELAAMWDWGAMGIRRFEAVPVVLEGAVEIVLLYLATTDDAPDRQDSVLVRNVASQLARFLERQRRDEDRARLAAIVDGSYDAIIGKSLDGRILSWNEGARRVYGYTNLEAVGQPISILLPEGVVREEPKILEATRSGRRLSEFETWRRHASGREILVSITVSPIKDSRGRVIGSSTVERDVTKRRERELELRDAVEAAERANRTKSEFLANISHELRTPMNAIMGMLDLALGESIDDDTRDYLDTARDSANTLLYLLNDLLDFSRMEAGRFELDDEPFQLRSTIDAVVKPLSLRAYEKGLEIACRIDPDIPDDLRGDGRRLRQILVNLVGNAIKFTEQGEIYVDAGVERRKNDQIVVRITIRDTGIGIAEDDLETIFEAFEQADASSTRQYQGTGLGLAIVRELVQKMHGDVSVESRLGAGSAFSFTARFGVLAPSTRVVNSAAAVEELRDLPVLVVDDNATNRTILAEMLQNWRMQPVVVSSATDAIERLRAARANNTPFPVVIVDALMPEVDGFDLVRCIREEQLTDRGTVLMLSSADRQTFKDQTEDLEIDAYLEKPVSQSSMLDVIMTTLRGPQLDRSAVRRLSPAPRALHVLVAEDTPANQKVVRSILAKRGHLVDVAHNGREALDLHEDGRYDVILMDVQMPTMDGLQATRAIRQLEDPDRAAIPIIAMTAHAMQGDRERCLSAGMDAYLAKPIDARRLVRLVEELARSSDDEDATSPTDDSQELEEFPIPNEQTGDTGKPFDRSIALTRLGGDEQLLRELLDYYRNDSTDLLRELAEAVDAGKAEVAHRAAHSLKGLSANLEAVRARDAAREIEEHAKLGRLDEVKPLLPGLRAAIEEVCAAFDNDH